jgi:limonene-1,2-epoxide hydrolase
MDAREPTRRTLFAAAGGLAALAAAGDAAAEVPASEAEAANIRLVKDFCATWAAPNFDADAVMAAYLAADCHVRPVDSQPFVSGPAAVAAAFKQMSPNGERYRADFQSIFARGPIVVTDRIDTQLNGAKAGQKFAVVGVFYVRDGKIREWTDYLVS